MFLIASVNLSGLSLKKEMRIIKKITRIWSVGELSLAFDAIDLLWFPQDPKPEQSLVILRDYRNPKGKTKKARGNKVDLEVPETKDVREYRSNLYKYNQYCSY